MINHINENNKPNINYYLNINFKKKKSFNDNRIRNISLKIKAKNI